MSKEEDVKEILDGRREFTFESPGHPPIKAYIAPPSGEDIRKADWQYAKVYNQAIVDGFLTQAQMLDLLKEKGIISDEYAQEVERTKMELATQLYLLENSEGLSTESEREAAAMEIARLRDELFRLNQKVNGPMGSTCENLAEDARIEFLTSRIVQKKDRSPFWKSYEDYQKDDNVPFAVKARFEVMIWLQGLESNFMENTPEQVELRKIAQRRLEQAVKNSREQEKKEKEEAKKVVNGESEAGEPVPAPSKPKRGRRPKKEKSE